MQRGLPYLEVAAADEQVDFAAVPTLQGGHGLVYLVQLAVAAALYCNLQAARQQCDKQGSGADDRGQASEEACGHVGVSNLRHIIELESPHVNMCMAVVLWPATNRQVPTGYIGVWRAAAAATLRASGCLPAARVSVDHP